MSWVEQARNLLYQGESIETQVRVGDGGVVVTSHRVLGFTPDREGANFRGVDRPNVEDIDLLTTGEMKFLEPGIKGFAMGIVLLIAGFMISFDSLVEGISFENMDAAGTMGLGGMIGMMQTLLGLMAIFDDIMIAAGAVALVGGVGLLCLYIVSLKRLLVVRVAGSEDLRLTAPQDDEERVVETLRTAVTPENGLGETVSSPAGSTGTPSAVPDESAAIESTDTVIFDSDESSTADDPLA